MKIIASGNSIDLSAKIAHRIGCEFSIVDVKRFPNNEVQVKLHIEILDSESVYIVHSYGSNINNSLVELFFLISKIKSMGPKRIFLVLPYLGYSRHDKTGDLSLQCIGKILKSIGVDKVISIDVHSAEAIKLIGLPLYSLSSVDLFSNFISCSFVQTDLVLVSPDKGRSGMVKKISDITKVPYLALNKSRNSLGKVEYAKLSFDVTGKECCIIDDIIDTGATISSATELLLKNNAKSVYGCCTHATFSENLVNVVESSGIKFLAITDSTECALAINSEKVRIISVAYLIACHIRLMEKTDNV